MITLDKGALLALFLPDAHSARARAALALVDRLGVSDFAIAEASAVIAARARAGEIGDLAGTALSAAIDGWVSRAAERIAFDAVDGHW